MTLATAGSRPKTVIRKDYKYVKMEKKSQQMVSIEAYKRAQVETGVSSKVMMTFAKAIRHDVTVESNLRPDLIFMKKRYADHFTVSNEVIDGKSVPVVYCKDTSLFLDCILQDRGCEKSSVFLRLSIDEGRGFLKGRWQFDQQGQRARLWNLQSIRSKENIHSGNFTNQGVLPEYQGVVGEDQFEAKSRIVRIFCPRYEEHEPCVWHGKSQKHLPMRLLLLGKC